MTLAVLILAAGRSARMQGPDKLLLPVGGVPLLRRTAQVALTTKAPCIVALPPDRPARFAVLDDLPVAPLTVPDAGLGMGHSLRAGVAALPVCDRFMVLLADMPDLTAADLDRLVRAATGPVTRATDAQGRPGHPVIFDAALRPDFAALTGDAGALDLIRRHPVVTVPIGAAATTDLDTPQDWARWQAAQR